MTDSEFEERIKRAQRVLDRSHGDLRTAVTKAAFRLPLVLALAEVWPKLASEACPKDHDQTSDRPSRDTLNSF